ncbi:MAG: Hpt domain-containing protein [Gammaproteobacteria bacterium]|nr:Hpt domain-containing protein [Gammaproteobacteria bacterium]
MDEMQDKMEKLYEHFHSMLPERWDSIDTAWKNYLDSNAADSLDQVRFHLHKLAGAASTYGFTRIGDTARSLEHALDDCFDQNSLDNQSVQPQVSPELAQLQDLIQNCSKIPDEQIF